VSNVVWSAENGWHDGEKVDVRVEHGKIVAESNEKGFPELAAEFTAWKRQRQEYGETDGMRVGPTSGQWEASDDRAFGMLEEYADKVRALNAAVSDLEMLDGTMWGDVAEHFGCTEASVLGDLLVTLGLVHDAEMLMTCHYYADDVDEEQEVEMHTDSEGVRDERIRPSILFGDSEPSY